MFTKGFPAALPTAHNFSQEGLNRRNRKETKTFCSIWPRHLRKAGVHPQDEINRNVGARDKRERASRGRQYKVGRKGKKWKNYKRIMTNFHLSLKSQMRKEEIRISKWEKKSEAPFETIEEEGVWTSNLIYERQGWTWAGLQHLIRNGAGWLYPRRSSEAKNKTEGQHTPRNRVGLLTLCSEIGAWQLRYPVTETLQRDAQESKTTGRTITKQNSRSRKVSKPDSDVRKELNLTHAIKKAVTSHFVGPVSFPAFQHFLSSGIWY